MKYDKQSETNDKLSDNFPLSKAIRGKYYSVIDISFPKNIEKRFKEIGLTRNRIVFVTMKTDSFIVLRLLGFYLPLRISEADSVIVKNFKSPCID